ncbi:MAG: hypothetical protein MJ231_05155 [bacterium]|nr:hypothetical protein [bacterium]
MKKKLYKSGNAWVLLMQKPILELLDINPEEDELELEVEGKVLKVKKAEDNKKA